VNDKEFRQRLVELLARQRNPDQPAKKNAPTPELPPKPATMSNKEFRKHLKQFVARQGNEDQPTVEKKPPKPEPPKPIVVTEKKPPTTETRKFNVRRKAK
jgi:hypothetical protein